MTPARFALLAALVAAWPSPASAQSSLVGETLHISRASGPIKIDGDLSDEGWRGATRIEKWYEVQPGDNNEPPVRNVGLLTFDDRFLYVGFELDDPHPRAIRAPLGDHDNINGNSTDFAGIFVDPLNSGRTALEFFVSPSNVQYDAVTDDASGENPSPDFFWDSAAKINDHGWTLEIRIPFSSLRYKNVDPQTWGIILFRNYPRQSRYQFFSARLPKNGNCLVCRENRLLGLDHLPAGGHLVVAPYVSSSLEARVPDDADGNPLLDQPLGGDSHAQVGLDLKYTPNANNAMDLTIKPDFSQVEADTAQISANERFALFFPEKRPFFLEGVDLFQMPFQAVYTRTITSPEWGGRITGKDAGIRYTALITEDEGGGSVILPGANSSSSVNQDVPSTVFVGRAKRDIGLSFVGAMVTDRESREGDAHNRVAGPDFQWRPSASDVVTGQWLTSDTRTPNRPDLADEWNGQTLHGSAFQTYWNHNTRHFDTYAKYADVGSGFRADTGFIPQVGYREAASQTGWQVYPKGLITRERTFLNVDYQAEPSGAVITRDVEPGVGMDTKWSGFLQLRYIDNRTRAGEGGPVIGRKQFGYVAQFSPSRKVSLVAVNGTLGQDIDFDNARPARGPTINGEVTLQPTDHLAVDIIENVRRLSVDDPIGRRVPLFTQQVQRLKGTYTFTSRLFVRIIAQYVSTASDPALYVSTTVMPRAGDFGGSALLAYKINWQSVMFVGYGDDRELTDLRRLAPLDHQFFVKVSHAFQR
ncbi:MAG TPA: DUF5916 domain-containing protein [Vicinamibacterales bacterium]|nr:DUF5916 domain-containing protein [Vicinamibacterales bacterium]